MAFNMGDTEQLIKTMDQLNSLTKQLIECCQSQQPQYIVFEIEKIKTDDEDKVLRDGIQSLNVSPLFDNNPRQLYQVLASWKQFYKADGYSTKFVDRLPGIVVITENCQMIKTLVDKINRTKDIIASIVRNGRDQYERHKFIHDTFNFIMTEQVYRHIHYFEHDVSNAWFNWARRPVPKTYSIEQALKMLEEQFNRPKYFIAEKDWQQMITAAINDVNSGTFDYIQQLKDYRVLPTIELQYINEDNIKKRKKSNATTPVILLGQNNKTLPKFSNLKAYINKNKDQAIKLRTNKTMINPYLKLVGVKTLS
ncbi:DNA replication terminus site-binding protein [Thalassotalea agariperforans]